MIWLRRLSESQWIMLMTVAVIGSLLFVATSARAAYHTTPPSSTTLSHCGWVQAKDRVYTDNSRNTKIIQRKLTSLGYSVGPAGIDGRYGHDSQSAARNFQHDYNLTADGVVGPKTTTALAYVSHPVRNVRRCQRNYEGATH